MKKPVSFLCLLLCFLLSNRTLGQGENNIWCFGEHQGLDFNAGPPVLYQSNIFTQRGCATVCDATGSLLFYTSGVNVWDRNDVVMPNGNGLTGGTIITQGSAIVPSYTNTNRYYIFHLSTTGKLYYTIVDMSLNFNLGDVVAGQKNILVDSLLSEKMIVIGGVNCHWLLTHKKSASEFRAFRIDDGGINTSPVVSLSGFYNTTDCYKVGEMKISPDNSMLVLANNNNNTVELHSFDYASGIVSNPIFLDTNTTGKFYGASFSPDGTKLYIGKNSGTGLFQYDLSFMPNVAAVLASKTTIASSTMGGMRIGPDNKIYVTVPYANLSVINDPNLPGLACNYAHAFGPFPKGHAFETDLGNPYIPLCPPLHSTIDTFVCYTTLPVNFSAVGGYSNYVWSDGCTVQTNTFSATGSKWVMAYNSHCDIRIDTFNVTLLQSSVTTGTKDTAACFVNTFPIVPGPGGYTTYLWSDGFTQASDTFSAPGTKWVKASQSFGCIEHIDTITIHAKLDTTRYTLDTSLCVAYIPRVINAQGGYTSYLWSDGITQQSDTFMTTGTKWVQAQNGCNLLVETVNFTANNIPQDSLFTHSSDSTICFESTPAITVVAQPGYADYLWSDGTPGMYNSFNSQGLKWVYAQKGCLMLVDTFGVFTMPTDTTTRYNDTDVCFEKQLTITATDGYLSYLWNNGNSGQANTIHTTSINWVYMHKACAERIDTFDVRLVDELSVNLGTDSAICKGENILLNATSTYPDAIYTWQDNSAAPNYNVTKGGAYWVKVTVGDCSVSDTVRVQDKKLNIDLGDGKVPCGKTELVLDPGIENGTYHWSDGSSEQTLRITANGSYTVHVTEGTCSADASISVTFDGCPCVVFIPNAFSPNRDGLNDNFGPTTDCPVNGFHMVIYNRWGNMVFQSEDIRNRWDGAYKGTLQDYGLFYYYIQFKDAGGHNYYYKGDVTLVK